jgi:hypothetical protein
MSERKPSLQPTPVAPREAPSRRLWRNGLVAGRGVGKDDVRRAETCGLRRSARRPPNRQSRAAVSEKKGSNSSFRPVYDLT